MWAFFSRDPLSNFPFEVGEKVEGLEENTVWTLHEGKRKANGEPVSVFMIDLKESRAEHIETAKAAHKRIKTLRHPNFVTFIDGLESENAIYVVTEYVKPLCLYLKEEKSNNLVISWGLHQVVKGLSFLHNDCKWKHNNINMSSIFVNPAGEWKLGGVDYITCVDGEGTSPLSKLLPALDKYDPPEMSVASKARRKTHAWSADMWGLGCLIWEVYNGDLPRTSSLKALGKIPKNLVPSYCELVSANPMSRPNPAKFIDNCKSTGGFMDNKFVETNLFLEEIQIKDQSEKTQFLRGLSSGLDDFPEVFCKLKILPLLLQAFEFGNAGSAILTPLLKLGKLLETEEYEAKIVPCVVKMFSSTDRATRVKLLQQMDQFVEYLKPGIVNDQIFPHVCHGFNDTNPLIRENTVKAMLMLAPKLSDKNLNIEMLKHFARLQSKDEQGGIRTNTTICLGKIACHLNPVTRQKVLSSAYVRAMKDPFPPARSAGVISMLATQKYFSLRDSAFKVLPTLCTLTVDPDKSVRDETFKAIKSFLERLESCSNNPDLISEIDAEVNAEATSTSQAASAGWTGWAMSSAMNITSKLYRGKGPDGPTQKPTPGAVPTSSTADKEQVNKDTKTREPENDEARDSQSDYGDDEEGDNGGGWDDFEENDDKNSSGKQADDWNSGWDEGNQGDDDDGWTDLKATKTKPTKPAKIGSSKPFKLSGPKIAKNEPTNEALGIWGDDDWGPSETKSSASLQKKSSPSKSKLKTSPKREKPVAAKKDDWDMGSGGGGWDDDGEGDGWGEMGGSFGDKEDTDTGGWEDNDDWGSIEEPAPPPSNQKKKATVKAKSSGGLDDFVSESSHTPASSYNWDMTNTQEDDFFSSAGLGGASKSTKTTKPTGTTSKTAIAKSKAPAKTTLPKKTSDWGDDDGWGGGEEGWGADDDWGAGGAKKQPAKSSKVTSKPVSKPKVTSTAARTSQKATTDWGADEGWGGDEEWGGDDDWGSGESNQGLNKAELAKKQREEKRKERERQIQEKRAARKAQGPSKLGAKKD